MTEEVKLSALEENIARKGTNAYYYAHGKKIEGPGWDGREEPRLLGTSPVTLSISERVNSLDTFSWLDDEKYVKIIVEFEGAGDVADEDIILNADHEKDQVNFKFQKDGKSYVLHINPLHDAIENATFRKKNDKFIIKLQKITESSWHQLKK